MILSPLIFFLPPCLFGLVFNPNLDFNFGGLSSSFDETRPRPINDLLILLSSAPFLVKEYTEPLEHLVNLPLSCELHKLISVINL